MVIEQVIRSGIVTRKTRFQSMIIKQVTVRSVGTLGVVDVTQSTVTWDYLVMGTELLRV